MRRLANRCLPAFMGCVEITTFGHNRYKGLVGRLRQPVISLAKSPLKNAEAQIVGDSAVVAMDMLLREKGSLFCGDEVGVLGFGSIGQATARALRAKGHRVSVFDKDATKLVAAKLEGFGVAGSKKCLLASCEYLFSATATRAVDTEDRCHFRDGLTLVSVGSKANEFDVQGLIAAAEKRQLEHDGISLLQFAGGQSAKIVRMGKAINFRIQSCPDEVMDLVFAETLSCINALQDGLPVEKLNELSDKEQHMIASTWLRSGEHLLKEQAQ